MHFTEADTSGGLIVQSYEPGRLLISGKLHQANLILTPTRILPDWDCHAAATASAAQFAPTLSLKPEIILFGTGSRQIFPSPAVYAAVLNQGIGLEVMDTGAACRTYNILMSEGRRVAAALIIS
jgi:uncharacterized protein